MITAAARSIEPLVSSRRQMPSGIRAIGGFAADCLVMELETWPKPGLVSHVDNGSHVDMDAGTFRRSAAAIRPYLQRLAEAGALGCGMGGCGSSALRPNGRCSRRPRASTRIVARSSVLACCARRPVRGPAGWSIRHVRSATSWHASGAPAYSTVRCCCTAMAALPAAAFAQAEPVSRRRAGFPASTGSACRPCGEQCLPRPRMRKRLGSRRALP